MLEWNVVFFHYMMNNYASMHVFIQCIYSFGHGGQNPGYRAKNAAKLRNVVFMHPGIRLRKAEGGSGKVKKSSNKKLTV